MGAAMALDTTHDATGGSTGTALRPDGLSLPPTPRPRLALHDGGAPTLVRERDEGVPERPDAVLVQQVLDGDVEAFAVLVGRYRDRLARYATRLLGNVEDAEEVVQDTFVRAYRAIGRCEDPARFGSWLFSILINRCRTAGGRSTRRQRTVTSDEAAVLAASVEPSVDRSAWREEIERALTRLDEDQREAFLLKHVEELSYEEISEMTGVGISALKMRVKRACDRMRVLLQEAYHA
jgi:RNA polymerase sigma-70 factor, ECF subfamily